MARVQSEAEHSLRTASLGVPHRLGGRRWRWKGSGHCAPEETEGREGGGEAEAVTMNDRWRDGWMEGSVGGWMDECVMEMEKRKRCQSHSGLSFSSSCSSAPHYFSSSKEN